MYEKYNKHTDVDYNDAQIIDESLIISLVSFALLFRSTVQPLNTT